MSKAHDLAWAAGFFDGEGYITIQRRSYKGYTGHYLRIGINHVNPKPLKKMQSLFGGVIREQKTVYGNRHRRMEWGVSCNKATNILVQLIPYLVNKDTVAELALEFQKTMLSSYRGSGVPEEILSLREDLKQQIMSLNKQD
jgi:hypothetical protein